MASRSTCIRRSVGCVLTDHKGHILATGVNGVPSGWNHCNEGWDCAGANAKSGQALDKCLAVHAEQNALLQCPDVNKIYICYSTTSPCVHCVKLLLNTSCETIIFEEEYTHLEAKELWEKDGRKWIKEEL